MTKHRDADQSPWMSAPDYGRSLRPGVGFSLLVRDMARSVRFAEDVIGATATYWDKDFAAMRWAGGEWQFHADHTFSNNPLSGFLQGVEGRGVGVELRAYGVDPDRAEAAARAGGWTVLAGAMDKPHGLRECIIIDDDGYAWVPGIAI
jgi:catechol 2,3-dioxygenase-like lactoylglutathione lyase family enzyme